MEKQNRQKFRWKQMTVGVCYYPEHWSRELWEDDIDRMIACGITVVRIGEFGWSIFEPIQGVYDFELFDSFLDLCQKKGIKVIFGTPTATPPAWLTQKYPEILNRDNKGITYTHGGRRHYNYNSAIYQQFSCKIVEKLASHFGSHPAIEGWQIDNELNCETAEFHSEADYEEFRVFLRKKYGTLDKLNESWGTVVWSQTYTDWSQISGPRYTLNNAANPALRLDYYRFISESARKFCKMQADILKKYIKPQDYITTNGMFEHLDNHAMTEESLDVYTYDSYPSFGFGLNRDPRNATDLNDRKWTRNLNEVRSVCSHFGIMEQQSGANGWTNRMEGPAPRPGQLLLWAMQSVAQGADFVSFFRWRTAPFGTEIYWHGILDYDNRDNRKLEEVKDFIRKFKKLDPICGAENIASFAWIKDYDNEWDVDIDVWHKRVESASSLEIFAASELYHSPYNILYMDHISLEEMKKYPVAFYPHPTIMDQKRTDLLQAYVEQGGTLIIGCRSGYKNLNGNCVMMPQPGCLQKLTGTDVRDFTFASPNEEPVFATWDGQKMEVPIFNDILTPLENTRVLARYANSYYAGSAALTEHVVGEGRVLHMGSTFSRSNVKQLLEYTGVLEPFGEFIQAPEEVEVVMREKDGRKFLFVLNFQNTEQKIRLKCSGVSMYTSEVVSGEITMAPFETAVYELLVS